MSAAGTFAQYSWRNVFCRREQFGTLCELDCSEETRHIYAGNVQVQNDTENVKSSSVTAVMFVICVCHIQVPKLPVVSYNGDDMGAVTFRKLHDPNRKCAALFDVAHAQITPEVFLSLLCCGKRASTTHLQFQQLNQSEYYLMEYAC